MFLRVDTIFLSVRDFELARNFYAFQVGLPEVYLEDEFIGFSIGESTLVLEETDAPQINQSMISVVVDDLESASQELVERGIEFEETNEKINSQSIIHFCDPDGHTWVLVQE